MTKRKAKIFVERKLKKTCHDHADSNYVLTTAECSKSTGSYERHFTRKITVNDSNFLEAYVMANGICVLFIPKNYICSSISFDLDTDKISGKRKKGAIKLKAGSEVCTCISAISDQLEPTSFKTPVSGQLLEINFTLQSDASRLQQLDDGSRYVCVVYPDEHIPTVLGDSPWGIAPQQDNICYAWLKNSCSRGDQCRFKHTDASVEAENIL